MTTRKDCQNAAERVSRALMEASAAQDRATKKLLKLQAETFEAQKCFHDCKDLQVRAKDGVRKKNCIHPNAFSDMHAFIGSAIANSTGVRTEITSADREGQKICDMGGIPTPQGGGGGKPDRIGCDAFMADAYRIDKSKHTMA